MFGLTRNDHFSVVMNRNKNRRLVVMPISFGHPTATDKELSFVLRFVSDAPLFIRERQNVPRMDLVTRSFCLSLNHCVEAAVGHKILLEDLFYRLLQIKCSGTVFLYLLLNRSELEKQGLEKFGVSFRVQAKCRGMLCRTEQGIQQHETIAKGKKFQAAWRQYNCDFICEKKSRLLLVLVQSGQDTEFHSIDCSRMPRSTKNVSGHLNQRKLVLSGGDSTANENDDYEIRGIFNSIDEFDFDQVSRDIKTIASHASDVESAAVDLERALELSKQASLNGWGLEQQDFAPKNGLYGGLISSFEDDMSRAIQLSLLAEKKNYSESTTSMIVDLTEDVTSPERKTANTETWKNDKEKAAPSTECKRRLARQAALKRANSVGQK
eukprot:scaffold756_cov133-Cylindrotheca_fusiformis.AAC.3